MEVVLVLGLVVALTSLALPALGRPWAGQRLRSAADTVRAEFTRARVRAMSSGQTVVFRYTPDGIRYVTETCSLDASGVAAPDEFDPLALAADGTAALVGQERSLPQGVTFRGAEVAADSRWEIAAADEPAAPEWSDPIYFYPNGTASTARLWLANEYDDCVEVSLRGLTGVSTVSEVQARVE
jgi:hypothetical protein